MLFAAVQRSDVIHFFRCKVKTEQVEIFPDMVRIGGAGYYRHAALQIPAKDDLRGGRLR